MFLFIAVSSLSIDETGPRFLEEWSPTYAFSSRLGGNIRCGVHGGDPQWVNKDGFQIENVTGLREVNFYFFYNYLNV